MWGPGPDMSAAAASAGAVVRTPPHEGRIRARLGAAELVELVVEPDEARGLRERAQRLLVVGVDARVDPLEADPLEQVAGRGERRLRRDPLAPLSRVHDDAELDLLRSDAAALADRRDLHVADRIAVEQDQPGAETPLAPARNASLHLAGHPLPRQGLPGARRPDDLGRVPDLEQRVDVGLG